MNSTEMANHVVAHMRKNGGTSATVGCLELHHINTHTGCRHNTFRVEQESKIVEKVTGDNYYCREGEVCDLIYHKEIILRQNGRTVELYTREENEWNLRTTI